MRIRVNDKDLDIEDGGTVASVVTQSTNGLSAEGVAVALNDEVVPRTEWDRQLSDGDRIEIVRAVQGG